MNPTDDVRALVSAVMAAGEFFDAVAAEPDLCASDLGYAASSAWARAEEAVKKAQGVIDAYEWNPTGENH